MKARFLLTTLCIGLLPAAIQAAAPQPEARVIVKFRADSGELKRIQSADRARSLSTRLGLDVRAGLQPSPRMQVLRADGMTSEELARRLSLLDDVAYAVPDRIKRVREIPNDPLFPGQWYLRANQSPLPAALNAVSAWDRLLGSTGPVVAVLDTGIRPDHPDLAGRLATGYDFIANDSVGDGDGRDADPSDPGDYITTEEAASNLCGPGTYASYSSWHGTKVAGIIAAATNNGIGIAGLSRNGRIQTVRVLGKCGGYDSDILAAMRWAGGLSVPGVPDNATPARILNLSLASAGTCSTPYRDVVAELATRRVLVVAAAGNDTGPVEEPANCPGVLGVAGLRHVGTKVGYSSFGPEVGISAPAGNCSNIGTGQTCVYPINTTTNLGTTVPAANGYTDGNKPTLGTSFSSPQAAGVAALMLEAHPGLSGQELMKRIKASANPFPSDPNLPTCPQVGATGTDIEGQCNCTTSTCGAGMLDAAKAVASALSPMAAFSAPNPAPTNASVSLDGSVSSAAFGRSIVSWSWTLLQARPGASLINAASPVATLQTTSDGNYVVRLVVTDNQGASTTSDIVVTVGAGGTIDSGGGGGGGGGGSLDWAAALGLSALGLLAYLSRRRRVA